MVAVSGGVDSMVLLDRLAKQATSHKPRASSRKKSSQLRTTDYRLIVAHFNHGIREDSGKDEKLVVEAGKKYGLPVEVGRAKLGKNASEEQARAARYEFLRRVKEKHGAKTIITAHHQDDLIETAFINLLRGTGRRGLTAIAQNPDVIRPLLDTSKAEVIKYAKTHKLKWREDESNKDPRYLRNYFRLNLIPKLSASQRKQLLENIDQLNKINPLLDQEIANLSQSLGGDKKINRQKFINLPMEIGREVLAYKLRRAGIRRFNRKTLERLVIAIKTAKPRTKHDVIKDAKIGISHDSALLSKGVN